MADSTQNYVATLFRTISELPTLFPNSASDAREANLSSLRALVIGINDYTELPRLKGAVPDAVDLASYLSIDLSIPDTQIVKLHDHEATRAEIIKAFENLSTDPLIKRGDPIVIYFAGHSAMVKADPNSEGQHTQTLMLAPHDVRRRTQGGSVDSLIPISTVMTLVGRIAEAKGDNIVLILDCSHSGSARSSLSSTSTDVDLPGDETPPTMGTEQDRDMRSHVLLASCAADEISFETHDRGYFTQALLDTLRRTGAHQLTYRQCMENFTSLPRQHPLCAGTNIDRYFFNIKTASPDSTQAGGGGQELQVFFNDRFIQVINNYAEWRAAVLGGEDIVTLKPVRSEESAQIVVDRNQNNATYELNHLLSNRHGISVLSHTTSILPKDVLRVLSSAARWHWYVDLQNPENPFRNRVQLEFFPTTEANGPNLNRSGSITILANPEKTYGLKLINTSNRDLYPYLFYFDANGLNIESYYLGSTTGNGTVDPPLRVDSILSIRNRPGSQKSFTYQLANNQKRNVGFIKLFVTTSPVDFASLEQSSPFGEDSGGTSNGGIGKSPKLLGEWDTVITILVQNRSEPHQALSSGSPVAQTATASGSEQA